MKTIIAKEGKLTQGRMKKGYSMRKLSRKADIDVVTIHRIEAHKSKSVSAATAKKICNALNTEFDDLFEIVDFSKDNEKTLKEVR